MEVVKETKNNRAKEYEAAAKRLDYAQLVCPLSLKLSVIMRFFTISDGPSCTIPIHVLFALMLM